MYCKYRWCYYYVKICDYVKNDNKLFVLKKTFQAYNVITNDSLFWKCV